MTNALSSGLQGFSAASASLAQAAERTVQSRPNLDPQPAPAQAQAQGAAQGAARTDRAPASDEALSAQIDAARASQSAQANATSIRAADEAEAQIVDLAA